MVIPFIYKGDALSPKRRRLKGSTPLELNNYTVYTLSTADKLGHTKHMMQYLAHV